MDGWVKLHRSLLNPGGTFSTLTLMQQLIAIHLIIHANHKDGFWTDTLRGKRVEVRRGQLIISTRSILKWFPKNDGDITHQKIRTCLDRLEKHGFLTREATHHYTLVTLSNYGLYQGSDVEDNTDSNTEVTQTQHRGNTHLNHKQEVKNVKNDKKDKELKTQYAEFVSLTESDFDKLVAEHGEPATRDMIAILDNYKGSSKKKYADDYRAILSWVVDRYYEKPKRNEQHGGRTEGAASTDRTIAQGRTGWINRPKSV